jgi:hypothetical protein
MYTGDDAVKADSTGHCRVDRALGQWRGKLKWNERARQLRITRLLRAQAARSKKGRESATFVISIHAK